MVLGSLTIAQAADAQTFAEWFRQKSTQKKYLLQQIAALQVYSGHLRKGYTVAKGGLGSITNELLSENSSHVTYYNKLRRVDPVVARNGQVREILSWQEDIIRLFAGLSQLPAMKAAERNYMLAVQRSVFRDCEALINTLQEVVTDNKVQMSDADRLKLINELHRDMEESLRFTATFTGQAKNFARSRQQESKDNRSIKQAYGLAQ